MLEAQNIMEGHQMINEETVRKLRQLDLNPLVDALQIQEIHADQRHLTFDERLQIATDYHYQEKYNRRVKGILHRAKLRLPEAELRSVYYQERQIDRELLEELGTCRFLNAHQNIVFQGFTGSGKTYLSCAIGKEACKLEVRTRYIRLPDLLIERDQATFKSQGVTKLVNKYANFGLLIIDEWLLNDLTDEDLNFIFELIERRHDTHSTIITTNLALSGWSDLFKSPETAAAILDHLVHHSKIFKMTGKSYRLKHALDH